MADRLAAYLWLLLGFGMVGGYLAAGATTRPLVFGLVAASTAAVIVHGVRRHRPRPRRPWWLLLGAVAVFTGAAVLRVVFPPARHSGWGQLIPDSLAIPGYLLLIGALLVILRSRRRDPRDPARTDAFLVGVGALLAAWAFLIAPAVVEAGAASTQVVSASLPIFDTVLLALTVQLAYLSGGRAPVVWLLGAAGALTFVGDLTYALLLADRIPPVADAWFEMIFLLGFVWLGAAALHPSMRDLTAVRDEPARRMGPGRTLSVLIVAVAPTGVAALAPPVGWWDSLVRVAITTLLAAVIVTRVVRAHDAQTRAQSAARRAELAERRRATHDSLTDLPNRELLTETLHRWGGRANAAGQEISLLFLDLDRFKDVNDKWGHPVGDELLRGVGERLAGLVRADDLVCRIGGDEFVVALATDAPSRLAESLAVRVLTEFSQPFDLSVGQVMITPSIGVAHAVGPADAVELIRDADTAMYQAKQQGRNTVATFDQAVRDQVRHRVDLDQALRGALDRGELSLAYQPIVELQGELPVLSGFEALLRWRSEEFGFVSPMEFIPIAEDTGLIVPIGEWVLAESARQLRRWRQARPPGAPELHVSVNVAVRQLHDSRLAETVRRVLVDNDLPPSALWLEITESGVMSNHESSVDILRGLRAMGMTLCIDDFGTGHSSLSYLRLLPAEIVKIDKSFVMAMGESAPDETIVRAIIGMSKALGRRVVAEGVETAEQRDRLRALGADLGQGYLFGAPRAAAEETGWLDWPPVHATATPFDQPATAGDR